MIPPKELLEALFSRLGVEKTTTIALYDNMNSRLSTQMFWTLRYYGHEDIRIFDGGWEAWEKAGNGFTSDVLSVESSQYIVDHINE